MTLNEAIQIMTNEIVTVLADNNTVIFKSAMIEEKNLHFVTLDKNIMNFS